MGIRTDRRDRPQVIGKLVKEGHSPIKALEIAMDAERGDSHALAWIMRLPNPPIRSDAWLDN